MTRRRALALVVVWTAPSALLLALTTFVYARYRIPPPARLTAAARAAVIAPLRAALEQRPAPPCAAHAVPALRPDHLLVVTVWAEGRAVIRAEGRGPTACAAIEDAAARVRTARLPRWFDASSAATARIQVDRVSGAAPVGGLDAWGVPQLAELLAINPGLEGVGIVHAGAPIVIVPHELVAARVLAARRPSATMGDFAMGVDLPRIRALLASRAGLPREAALPPLFRFRTDTFVEAAAPAVGPGEVAPPRPAPIALYRGVPPPPPLTGAALRAAALEGGRYLVAHLAPSGRYVYEHDLASGRQTDPGRPGAYSMPRHAGTTYFLAELYRHTREPWLREPIERAFRHLAELLAAGRCGATLPDGTAMDCVIDKAEPVAHLGSTALTVVALVEYQRATGDARYLPLATRLAAFLLFMQRPDGSFRHVYDPATRRPDEAQQLFYYSGEAALALARMHLVTGEARYADAARRALDWLVGWYDFFLGGFFYGEEHWTCIAAEAAWPAVKDPRYVEFCHGYGAFLRAQQPARGDHPDQDDYAGAYNFTSFVPPYNTPAGSRTEAMISAYQLGHHHGRPDPAVRAQIRAALAYVLGQQVRPDGAFSVIGAGLGGMPGSPIDRTVRIDYVQHVCSAMIRAAAWIDGPGPPLSPPEPRD